MFSKKYSSTVKISNFKRIMLMVLFDVFIVIVSAGIAEGYNIGLVSAEIERKFANYALPEGYRLVFSGENEMINDALGQVALMLLLALVLLYSAFCLL